VTAAAGVMAALLRLRVVAAVVVIVTPRCRSVSVTVPIMRAGGHDAIGQLADAGDDCGRPGRYPRDGAAGPRSWPATQLASCTRDSRPSFARMCDTCVL